MDKTRVVADAVGTTKAPFIQEATLRARRKQAVQITASAPRSAPRTQSRKSNVARSRNPMSCFTRSIQSPGFGRSRSQAGWAESKRYGELIPAAIATNITRIIQPDCVKAKPSAVPRNGAVHGVASTVAKTP